MVLALAVAGCAGTTGAARPVTLVQGFRSSGARDMSELGYALVQDLTGTGDRAVVLEVAARSRVVLVVACTGPTNLHLDVEGVANLVDECGSDSTTISLASSSFTLPSAPPTLRVTGPLTTTWWVGVGTRVVTT